MAITKNSADSNVKLVNGNGDAWGKVTIVSSSGTAEVPSTAARANISVATTAETTLVAATASQSIYVMGMTVNSGADNAFTLGSTVGTTTTAIGGLRHNIDGVPQQWPISPTVDTAWFKTASGGSLTVIQAAVTVQDFDIVYAKK